MFLLPPEAPTPQLAQLQQQGGRGPAAQAVEAGQAALLWLHSSGACNGSSQAEDELAGSGGAGGSSNSRAAGSGKAWGGAAAEADSTEVLGPEVPCPDETAIFQELGLSYVPPHMRFFS